MDRLILLIILLDVFVFKQPLENHQPFQNLTTPLSLIKNCNRERRVKRVNSFPLSLLSLFVCVCVCHLVSHQDSQCKSSAVLRGGLCSSDSLRFFSTKPPISDARTNTLRDTKRYFGVPTCVTCGHREKAKLGQPEKIKREQMELNLTKSRLVGSFRR